ncbi:MAG: Carboxylesterase NlhH [Pseudomonadota bacterium]|jgi:acetyl esterase/lipase
MKQRVVGPVRVRNLREWAPDLGSLLGVALLCANVGCAPAASGSASSAAVVGGGAAGGGAAGGGAAGKVLRGLKFAEVGDTPLLLDLYLPAQPAGSDVKPAGLIIWVHGGAWRSGSRESADLAALTARGWALASVDYRLSPVARFPAQVHDIKAAIRHLRAHAAEHGLPAAPFVIAGSSAGAHLAALVGVSNGVSELEGEVGSERAASSDVQGIVSLYGASNLTSILAQSTAQGLSVRVPALELLLGGQPDQRPELARLASPVFHVDASDPPLLLLHGDSDPQMPIEQSVELAAAYEQLRLPAQLVVLEGAGHGGAVFTDPTRLELIDGFLRARLLPAVKH